MKLKDLILIGIILAVILISLLAVTLVKEEGAYVIVRVNGEQVARYELSKDGQYDLNGGTNVLRIEGGKAYLISADCPDLLCVNQGKIDESGEVITCLPNRLTITVYAADGNEIELIS